MAIRKLQITISIVAGLIAFAHIIWPNLTIDAVTLTLFMITITPWLVPLFKSIEFPGGWKFEFQELEKIRKEADKIGLLAKESEVKREHEYSFQMVAGEDPKLALAGLRIEIETRLNHIADSKNIVNDKRFGIRQLLQSLSKQKILTHEEEAVIADMVNILNNAVHGADVDHRAAQWAIEIGPRLLKGLDGKLLNK